MSNIYKFGMKTINPGNISDIDPQKISFITLIDGSIIVVDKNIPLKINNNNSKKNIIKNSVLFVISKELDFSIKNFYNNREIKSYKNNFRNKKFNTIDEEKKSINNKQKTRIKTCSIKNNINKNLKSQHNEENSFLSINSISNDFSQSLIDLINSSFSKNNINNKIPNKEKNKSAKNIFNSDSMPSNNDFDYPKKTIDKKEDNHYKKKPNKNINNKTRCLKNGVLNSIAKNSNNFFSNYINLNQNSQKGKTIKTNEVNMSLKLNKLLNKIQQSKKSEYKKNFVNEKKNTFHNLYKFKCNNFCTYQKFKTNRNIMSKNCSSLSKRIQMLQDKSKNNIVYSSVDERIINIKRFNPLKRDLILPSNKY